MPSQRYSRQLDFLDASVFSGRMLELNLDEFKGYLDRWQQEVRRYKQAIQAEGNKILIEITDRTGMRTFSLNPCFVCRISSDIQHSVGPKGYKLQCVGCSSGAYGRSWEEVAEAWNSMCGG